MLSALKNGCAFFGLCRESCSETAVKPAVILFESNCPSRSSQMGFRHSSRNSDCLVLPLEKLTEPCPGIRNHQFPARVEPIPYSGVSYSCGYSVANFLRKDDGKRRRAAANPWRLRTHEVRRDGRWEEGPAPHIPKSVQGPVGRACRYADRGCLAWPGARVVIHAPRIHRSRILGESRVEFLIQEFLISEQSTVAVPFTRCTFYMHNFFSLTLEISG